MEIFVNISQFLNILKQIVSKLNSSVYCNVYTFLVYMICKGIQNLLVCVTIK